MCLPPSELSRSAITRQVHASRVWGKGVKEGQEGIRESLRRSGLSLKCRLNNKNAEPRKRRPTISGVTSTLIGHFAV